MVQVDDQGYPEKRAYGPVWNPLPQSAVSAEWCASAVAMQLIYQPESSLSLDCSSVLGVLARGCKQRGLAGKNKWAGYFMEACTERGWGNVNSFIKVKAHLSLESAGDDLQLAAKIRANEHADHCAKLGAKSHPAPSPQQVERHKVSLDVATTAIKVMAKLLPLWPREKGMPRTLKEPVGGSFRKSRAKHDWYFAGGKWQCRVCMTYARSDRRARSRGREFCPGRCEKLVALLKDPVGHRLMVADVDDAMLVACYRCGSWMTSTVRGLGKPCPGIPTAAGKAARTRLEKGWHPTDGWPVEGLWSLSQCIQMECQVTRPTPLDNDPPPQRPHCALRGS